MEVETVGHIMRGLVLYVMSHRDEINLAIPCFTANSQLSQSCASMGCMIYPNRCKDYPTEVLILVSSLLLVEHWQNAFLNTRAKPMPQEAYL